MSGYGAPYGDAQGAGDAPPRPPTVREQVRASKEFYQANSRQQVVAEAGLIIARHAGDINQFMLGQRQMGIVLPASYKRKDYRDLSMEYQRYGAQETLILTAYPEADNPDVGKLDAEINYDGYCLWVHRADADTFGNGSGTINGNTYIPGPFDIFFNQYLLETQFIPSHPAGGYIVLFGKTALMCESAQDQETKNTVLNNAQASEKPMVVTPRPGWGKYEAGSSPTGVSQPQIDKVLGYWLFDWLNPHNPCLYFYDPTNNANPRYNWLKISDGLIPNITKGIWFEDPTKSPLDHKGPTNNMSVNISPGGKDTGETIVAGVFFAEFYDRTKGRSVKQSWTKPFNATTDIIVSDSPRMYVGGYLNFAFWGGGSMGFDLSPNLPDSASAGPHDGVVYPGGSTSGTIPAESPEDLAKFKAWQDQCAQILKQWNDKITQATNAWTTEWSDTGPHKKELNQAENVTAFWSNLVDSNGNELKQWATFDDRTTSFIWGTTTVTYGPVQQYWYDWNAPFVPGHSADPLPRVATYWFFSTDNPHNTTLLFVNTAPDVSAHGGSWFGGGPITFQAAFMLAAQFVKSPTLNALLQKQAAFDQIAKDNPPPKLPDAPVIGADYRKFSYRTVTGGNGSFSYPAQFSGGQ